LRQYVQWTNCQSRPTRCGHVGPKTEPRNVDEQIVGTEIVQDVPLRLVREHHISRDGHEETAYQAHTGRDVCDGVESGMSSARPDGLSAEGNSPVQSGHLDTLVDEHGVVMADKLTISTGNTSRVL
jgi:hypothetical protein